MPKRLGTIAAIEVVIGLKNKIKKKRKEIVKGPHIRHLFLLDTILTSHIGRNKS